MSLAIDGGNASQGSDDWRLERSGRITGSCFGGLVWTPGEHYKSGERKGQPKSPPLSRTNYIYQVAAEILVGGPKEQFTARATEHGKRAEPLAVARYENHIGQLVEQCGFIVHPDYPFIGASPDFLAGADGGGEIKCPLSIEVHLRTIEEGIPEEHIDQIQGGLWATSRLWWDFVSFHERFPRGLDLYVKRVYRDNQRIALIKESCLSAWDEVQAIVSNRSASIDP